VDKLLESLMLGQSNTRPKVIFPAADSYLHPQRDTALFTFTVAYLQFPIQVSSSATVPQLLF